MFKHFLVTKLSSIRVVSTTFTYVGPKRTVKSRCDTELLHSYTEQKDAHCILIWFFQRYVLIILELKSEWKASDLFDPIQKNACFLL